MTIVQHILTGADGRPMVNVSVPVRLAGNGFVAADKREIIRAVYLQTDDTGLYAPDLLPNSQIDPAGTHYEATHPGGEVLSFVVTDSAGPLWLRDLLVENPAAPSGVIAGMAATDNGDGTFTIGASS